MKIRVMEVLLATFLAVFFAKDYFSTFFLPSFTISKFQMISLLAVVLILILLVENLLLRKAETEERKDAIPVAIFIMYIAGLIVLFHFLGGTSTIGLEIDSPIIWILFAQALYDVYKSNKFETLKLK